MNSTLYQRLEQWWVDAALYLPKFILAIVVFFVFYILSKFIKKHSFNFYQKNFSTNLAIAKFISSVLQFVSITIGVFLILEILDLGPTLNKFIASAGIIGLAASFALKNIASNAFAGLLVNVQRPFKKGDWVNLNGTYGKVKNIGWITTSIHTSAGQEVFVPNNIIYTNNFTNYSAFGKRQVVFKTGVSYGDDLELVKKAALEEVKKVSNLLSNEPIYFYFTDIGGSSYNFELRFWISFKKNTDYLESMHDIIMLIKKRFEQENFSIPYNVTTLDFGVKGGVNIFDQPIELEKQIPTS